MKSSAAKYLLYGSTALLLLFLVQSNAYADSTPPPFTVDVNTAALEGYPPNSFVFGLVLLDPTGPDSGNTLTITDFAFGSGSAGSDNLNYTSMPGASGDLSSGVTITDASTLTGFGNNFTPGSTLSFLVTPTVDPSDLAGYEFVLVLFDQSNNEIPTTDPSGNDFLAEAQIVPGGGSVTVTPYAIVTPEPSTLLLLCCGLAALALGLTRKRGIGLRRPA
jgi:hypothetical protein